MVPTRFGADLKPDKYGSPKWWYMYPFLNVVLGITPLIVGKSLNIIGIPKGKALRKLTE